MTVAHRPAGTEFWQGTAFEEAHALQETQEKLGNILPAFIHSYEDTDASRPVALHPQLIADTKTVIECIRLVSPVKLVDSDA